MSINTQEKKNYVYLYDLPMDEVSSVKIAEIFKNEAGITIYVKPQIKKDLFRPFATAIVNLKNQQEVQTTLEKLRYFKFTNG
jgi:type II secretory pathway component GspD/PulD (secretin)